MAIGSKPPGAATKGKSTLIIKKSDPAIELDDSNKSLSLSSLQSDDGSDNDNDNKDDNDYDVAQMTDREARQMFNNEVLFVILHFVCELKAFALATPGCRS